MKQFLFILGIAFLAACTEAPKEKSETLKEAEKVHETMLELKSEVANMIHEREEALEKRLTFAQENDDQELYGKYEAMMAKLQEVHTKFHDWESNIAEIPGHAHTHEPGEHHDHDHDHAQMRVLEGLSDEEHLAIQKEQLESLQRLRATLENASR